MNGTRIGLIAIIVVALIGSGYLAYTRTRGAQAQEPDEPALHTATVTRGNIVLTAGGSGELVPARELDLSFRTGGYLAEVLVETGDGVAEGDLLASLTTDELEQALAEAELELRIAQLELAEVRDGPSEVALVAAETRLRNAQLQLTGAYNAYQETAEATEDRTVEAAKESFDWWVGYYQAQKAKYEEGKISQADHDWAMAAMIKADEAWQRAINEAHIRRIRVGETLREAQEGVAQTQADLELLRSQPLTDTLMEAEMNVDEALLAREQALGDLEAANLRAPFHGTVMGVAVEAGARVGMNTTILTLAKMEEPQLRFWLEELDMSRVAVGNQVNVIFEALPDYAFTAVVVRVDPVLVTVGGTQAVRAQARLELGDHEVPLLSGMTAEVEVIGAEARNVLLVPVEALKETPDGSFLVTLVKPDGELEECEVEVGLRDPLYAEILSGLQLGDIVVIGR